MTPEGANRRLSLTPPADCRNSFSSCNDGKATSDDLHRKDWDGSSPQAGPGGSSPTVLPSRRGAILDVDRGSLLDADQHTGALEPRLTPGFTILEKLFSKRIHAHRTYSAGEVEP